MVKTTSTQPDPGPFAIPALAVASHPDVMLNARDLRRWMERLPMANPVKAASLLLLQLRLLTRDPQRNPRLGVLLEHYREPLRQLQVTVSERLPAGLDCALLPDQLESLLIDLLAELAFGHLRIANEQLATGKTPGLEVLFPAISLLDDALGVERLHYCRLSTQRWRLLLHIYLRAEHGQLADQPVDAKLRPEDGPDTIRALFLRALLVSLCDPHNQAPGDMLAWHRWAGNHLDLLALTVLPQGTFTIPIDISGEQAPLTGARKSRPGPDTRYLACDGFIQALEKDESAPKGLRNALTGLIKGRRTQEQRRAERQPRNHPYRLIHGMRDIHRRLSELTQGGDPGRSSVEPMPCRQVNQSRYGAAFQLQGPVNPPFSIGEPVLAEAEASQNATAPVGFAARLRRVFSEDGRRIEIGVEKILGRLIPVTIVGAAAERCRGDTLALLQHDTDSGRYTLLAARSIYREGDHVLVQGPSITHKLRMQRLGGIVQHTAHIDVEPIEN